MNAVPRLGVGLLYQKALHDFVVSRHDELDFLQVVPDTFWSDSGVPGAGRFETAEARSFLAGWNARRAVVPHGIGLSLGSAHRMNDEHLDAIERWWEWLRFPWHSDHLAFNLAEVDGQEVNVGLMMPVPYDDETLNRLVDRIRVVRSRVPAPFAVETNADVFRYAGEAYDAAAFLNALCAESGCYILLDLHNLWANARNVGEDLYDFLASVDLSRVIEIHLAGGFEHEGFYLDAHSGPVPEPLWRLLDEVLPRCPNVGGLVFELLGSWYEKLGPTRLGIEIDRMREAWRASGAGTPARRTA